MANQKLGMFPLQQVANPYGNPPSPFARQNVGAGNVIRDPGADPCPHPALCWNGVECVECDPNVNPITDPVLADPDVGHATADCMPPVGGCPPGKIWQQSTCDCVAGQLGGPSRAPRDVQRSVPSMNIGVGGARGSLGGVEYGAFNRAGGGAGGGAMTDLEVYENPMLEMGSPFLGKNVSQFNKGGRMRSPYYDNGGVTHTMPDGTVHPGATHEEYMSMMNKYKHGGKHRYDNGGQWQQIARAMNGILGLGQAANVMQGTKLANPRPRRRFVKGGRF